jgi:broad specificity phosphatase PhoE
LSTLYLIRHAQASFLEENYDKLSSLGETQSTLLGGHLANRGLVFDKVFVGPRERQKKTCELVGRVFQDAKLPWPEPEPTPELDEYQGDELLRKALPRLMSEDVRLQTLAAEFAQAEQEDKRARAKRFQKMFEHVMLSWVRGEIAEDGVEPWAEFNARIGRFVEKVRTLEGKGLHVIAFTSGGSVAGVLQHALRLGHEEAIEVSWMVKNSSVTELAFNPAKLTLSSFNAIPHLQSDKLITYR